MAASPLTTTTALVMAILVAMATRANTGPLKSDYLRARDEIISEERKMGIGGKLSLTSDEQIVSDILVQEKRGLIDNSRLNRTVYFPAISFFHSKTLIENTTVFKLIRQMPKGALLHTHEYSAVSLDWVVKNATYRDNVFMCVDRDGYIILRVFGTPPTNPDCPWKKVSSERAASGNRHAFDQRLKNNLSLLSTDPLETYPNNAKIWIRFSKYFAQLANLLNYAPIYRDYIWQMLEEMRADNVQYVELRSSVPKLFQLDGIQKPEFAVEIFRDVTADFVKANPDFSGAKIILSGSRKQEVSTILTEVKTVITLTQKYPDVVKGYDMAGDEDAYNPVVVYVDALLYPSRLTPPYNLPYYLHAGETNWQGTAVDQNMVDAVLLNTRRIGHGFGLAKHPRLVELVKERDIAVEVNPISNQVLRLVSDLRNHAVVPLMVDGFPIVVGSDNFATWEALPLSHDLYVAFMDMSRRDADLTFLKQLIINSIRYSAMNEQEKVAAMKLWQVKWDAFIQEVVSRGSV